MNTLSYNLEFEGDYGFFTHVFYLFSFSFSVVCCLFVVMRENFSLKMAKNRGEVEKNDTIATTGKLKYVVLECFIYMLIPYPFFVGIKRIQLNYVVDQEIYYHFNDYLQLLSIVRLCYVMVNVFHITVWNSRSTARIWYPFF